MAAENVLVTFSPFLSHAAMDILHCPGHRWRKALSTLSGYARRLFQALQPGAHDVAFVYREAALLGPAWIERAISRKLPVVYDFDDAIYLPAASAANAWAAAFRSPKKVDAICGLSRHVVVGNERLADYARSRSLSVTVIPSTIDTAAYQVRRSRSRGRPVVGWTGSTTTLPYLKRIERALVELRSRVDYEFLIIGGEVAFPGVDVKCLPWRAKSEAEDIAALDVGIMPLPDDEWARAKCGIKALQYMAAGVPPVVSPVGVNEEIVLDDVNGFHARTEGDWVERLALLLRNAKLRTELGREARRTVVERYSARVHAPRMAAVLRAAAARELGYPTRDRGEFSWPGKSRKF